MPVHQGVNHIALSVTDAKRSAEFFANVLEGQSLISATDEHGPIEIILTGTLVLGFRQHAGTTGSDQFDESRVGLDHLGLGCASLDEVEKWRARLDELGIKHSGVVEDDFGWHLNARDPDNIPFEFFAAKQPA